MCDFADDCRETPSPSPDVCFACSCYLGGVVAQSLPIAREILTDAARAQAAAFKALWLWEILVRCRLA